jgi:valyl-tRNA synthetase
VTLVDPDGLTAPWWFRQLQALAAVHPEVGPAPRGDGFSRVAAGTVEAFISLEGVVDLAAERARLDKETADVTAMLDRSRAKLANAEFVAKAPADVVSKEQAKVTEFEAMLGKLSAQRSDLG